VQVRTRDFLVIRIAVRGATESKPGEDRNTSGAILVRALRQDHLATGDVQKEQLALVETLKRNANAATEAGVLVWSVVKA
jgi:hypothetical protein